MRAGLGSLTVLLLGCGPTTFTTADAGDGSAGDAVSADGPSTGPDGSAPDGNTPGPRWPDSPTVLCTNGIGQSTCPMQNSSGYGQDGNYRINVPTYTTVNQTVVDSVTNLVWQRDVSGQMQDFAQAQMYCQSLTLAGMMWRLPTRLELLSLVDYGRSGPAIDNVSLPTPLMTSFPYRTSTPTVAGGHWIIDFGSGDPTGGDDTIALRVRCVSGPPIKGTITALTDGTARDSRTGLVWIVQTQVPAPVSWFNALSTCENLTFAGENDWRLASEKELLTIVDETRAGPPVSHAALGIVGPGATPGYWASSPNAAVPDHCHLVDFGTAAVYYDGPVATQGYGRYLCVRGGGGG